MNSFALSSGEISSRPGAQVQTSSFEPRNLLRRSLPSSLPFTQEPIQTPELAIDVRFPVERWMTPVEMKTQRRRRGGRRAQEEIWEGSARMGTGNQSRSPSFPLLKENAAKLPPPTAPHGARSRPFSPQKILSSDGSHRRSRTTKPGRCSTDLGQRTASQTGRGNVADVGHDLSAQAVLTKSSRPSNSGCAQPNKPSSKASIKPKIGRAHV